MCVFLVCLCVHFDACLPIESMHNTHLVVRSAHPHCTRMAGCCWLRVGGTGFKPAAALLHE